MDTINACPRGHRYRASLLHSGRATSCPRCDRYALVALAYGDCQNPPRGCRLLDFRTESLIDFQEFCDLMSLIGNYNRFDPARVIDEVRPLFPRLMTVEIGREGSPVIYAGIAYWRHQEIQSNGFGTPERIPELERKEVGTQFLKAMERTEADELTFDGHKARAWWD